MPSMMTHAVVGAGALALTRFGKRSPALWVVSAALAALPDLDVITTIALGVPGGTMWSHRGITHSLAAAFLTGTLLAILSGRWFAAPRWPLALYFSLVMASHGILDAFTSGGRGVALFAPFDARRYASPVRPIPSSPLGLAYFSERGLRAFEAELLWVWVPILLVVGIATLRRARARCQEGPSSGR